MARAKEVETKVEAVEEKAEKELYKLADPQTQYAENDFTLVGEQEKELPENPSLRLIERIRSGFIKKV